MKLTAAVIVLSDRCSRGEREDRSGPEAERLLGELGFEVAERVLIPDEPERLRAEIVRLVDGEQIPLIVTSGGTGLSPRDRTPETTRTLLDREIPGIPEAIRAAGREKVPTSILSRGVAGVRRRSVVVNLPGSVGGVRDGLGAIGTVLRHAVETVSGIPEEESHRPDVESAR